MKGKVGGTRKTWWGEQNVRGNGVGETKSGRERRGDFQLSIIRYVHL